VGGAGVKSRPSWAVIRRRTHKEGKKRGKHRPEFAGAWGGSTRTCDLRRRQSDVGAADRELVRRMEAQQPAWGL